ncbi:MAG: hypothetical protein LQ342_003660 [Letrouitia transgressa]|nr:MAG: hypothetical protein LQ342_003660 [Letrouitia transgressa]
MLQQSSYSSQRWHQFLIYIGYNIFAFCVNAFANKLLPWVTRSAFTWSITGFVVISITLLASSSPNYSTGDFVFREFINETGWPNGIAWLLGLLQAGLGLTGFDAVAHMIEDYCIVAFTIVLFISTFQWFVDGRKNYTGPQIDVDALSRGNEPSRRQEGVGV